MHRDEPFESSLEPSADYEAPQVEDVELRAGTAETAPGIFPISQTG